MDKVKPDQGIEGELICPEAGQVVVTFANASTMWSRVVRFSFGTVDEGLESNLSAHAVDSCIALRAKKIAKDEMS